MKSRVLTILCVVYVVLVIYGSLMPFDLRADWPRAMRRLDYARRVWPMGPIRARRADWVRNIALYFPLGLLLAGRGSLRPRSKRLWALACATGAALATGLIVEFTQLFSASRIPGANDVAANTLGGLAGGIVGISLGRAGWLCLQRWVREQWSDRPMHLVAVLLVLLLAADAVFPFCPTVDVSTVRRGVRRSLDVWRTQEYGLAVHPLHHWLVRRVGVYAVLSILLGASLDPRGRPAWFRGALRTSLFALVCEIAKIFIVSRFANAVNVAASVCGAAAGAVIGAASINRMTVRMKLHASVAALVGYIAYVEWEPFKFLWDSKMISRKFPHGAQWLPLYHHAMRGKADDVHHFLRTLVLMAALVCAMRLRRGRERGSRLLRILGGAVFGGALGIFFELGQFLLPARIPSMTDVFCFAMGGVIGAITPLPRRLRYPVVEPLVWEAAQ
ncbi:MAG: VanZ family protein [Planctomycetes bacterium]|nr:VanZ family protein [Planctomycetota bacterium]